MVIIIATSKRMTANVTIGYNNNPSKSYAFGMTMFCIINKPSSNTFAKPYTNNTPTYPRPNPLPTPPYFLLPSPPLVGEGLGMGAILLSLLPCGGRGWGEQQSTSIVSQGWGWGSWGGNSFLSQGIVLAYRLNIHRQFIHFRE